MKNKYLIVGLEIILSICFILVLVLVLNGRIYSFDTNIYSLISKCISDPMTNIMKIITFFGSAYALITITVLLILFCKEKKYFGINLVFVFLFSLLLKIIIARPRPVDNNIINEIGYSFPSSHSMVSLAVYGFLIYYIYKYLKNRNTKWLLIILLSLLILLIGFSRIYLGVHYASDVLGGYLLSMIWLITFITIINRKTK